MKRWIVAAALAVGLAAVAAAGPVQAGDGGNPGRAVGQNPLRLALTQCSNAGGGNNAESLRFIVVRGEEEQTRRVSGECLRKKLARYDTTQLSTAWQALGDDYVIIIFPDPRLRDWLLGYGLAEPVNCQQVNPYLDYYLDFGAGWALPNGSPVWYNSSCLGLPNDTISQSGGAGFVWAPDGSTQAAARCAAEWPSYPDPAKNGTQVFGCV